MYQKPMKYKEIEKGKHACLVDGGYYCYITLSRQTQKNIKSLTRLCGYWNEGTFLSDLLDIITLPSAWVQIFGKPKARLIKRHWWRGG